MLMNNTSTTLFNQINIVPRWFIFILDLNIGFLSLTTAYLIKSNFDFSSVNHTELNRNILILGIISGLVFIALKTFSGIIRYTSAQDSFRILSAILITNGIFFLIKTISIASDKSPLISTSLLIINCLVCFLLMVS